MDKSAIQHLHELTNSSKFLEQLGTAQFPVAAIPESYTIHDLEKFMPTRNQFRGTMTTAHIQDFVRYHQGYIEEGIQCFIDTDGMMASTFFDIGTNKEPGHCKHRAALKLKKTASYVVLLDINGRKLSQKSLAEFIEDYTPNILVFDIDGNKIENSTASAAIRNMTFEAKAGRESTVNDFSQQQSQYESMAVRTKAEYPMPAVFKFTCEPYLGLPERTFELRMSTIGNEVLILRIKSLEQHEEEMSEEFQTKLQSSFDEQKVEIDTFIGSFSSRT